MFFPESFNELPLYPLVWVGIAYFIGSWWMKTKLTWSGQLSAVFSDGYELRTAVTITGFEERQKHDVQLDARITRLVLKNVVGKIMPSLVIYNQTGRRWYHTMEATTDGNVEISFADKIAATPEFPITLFVEFTSRVGTHKYLEINMTAPKKK